MSRVSNSLSVSISTAFSPMQTLAANTPVGSFAQFKLNNAAQNTALGHGERTGSVIPYCHTFPWNSHSRCIEILGRDHADGGETEGIRYVRYMEQTDSWDEVKRVPEISQGHGFDHTTINPYTNDLYHRLYGGMGFTDLNLFKKLRDSTAFVMMAQHQMDINIMVSNAWWSGSYVGPGAPSGLGAQGAMIGYSCGRTGGALCFYFPLTNTWSTFHNGTASPGSANSYNQIMEYSPVKNCAIYGGSNADRMKLWKLSSDGTVTAMPDVPSRLTSGVGIHHGTLCENPVTGNFYLFGNADGALPSELWELNPDGAGSWTFLSYAPVEAGQSNGETGGNRFVGFTPINNYPVAGQGILAIIRQTTQGSGAFYIYRVA